MIETERQTKGIKDIQETPRGDRVTERERERDRERQGEKQRERETDRQTDSRHREEREISCNMILT